MSEFRNPIQISCVSGKGGTGKTTLTAALSLLADNLVVADCDVDAANLNLLYDLEADREIEFFGGQKAIIDQRLCSKCGVCQDLCQFEAVRNSDSEYLINAFACEGCGSCKLGCPERAISMEGVLSGTVSFSSTDSRSFIYADLLPGEDKSGKLVAEVRNYAVEEARSSKRDLILLDGSPGIGCPVIAAVTGVDAVLIVSEASAAGFTDLKRIVKLVKHFRLKTYCCINKSNLDSSSCEISLAFLKEEGIECIGLLPYVQDLQKIQDKTGKDFSLEVFPEEWLCEVRSLWDKLKTSLKL